MINKMNINNFKTYVETSLKDELKAYQTGEKRVGFSNQFDRTVLESALENLNDESVEKLYNELNVEQYGYVDRFSPMDFAYRLSTFQPPEIGREWID